jgi:hypothetical protein
MEALKNYSLAGLVLIGVCLFVILCAYIGVYG